MTKLILCLAVLATGSAIVVNERVSRAGVLSTNAHLIAEAGSLRERGNELDRRRADLQRDLQAGLEQFQALRQQQTDVETGASAPQAGEIVPPDSTRQGGWPVRAGYFYLPKKDLGAVGYKVMEGNRLTTDAASLFGMSAAERSAVDSAYAEMWRKYRQLEIDQMEPVGLPAQWTKCLAPEESVSYRIPSLAKEAEALRSSFESSVGETLGAQRAGYLLEGLNAFIAGNLDNLGANARIISFGRWPSQKDGKVVPGYGIINEGINASSAGITRPLPADSQLAYYAQLFGVDVPIEAQ
jgi:hypothetical protein